MKYSVLLAPYLCPCQRRKRPGTNGLKVHQADGEQLAALAANLILSRVVNLSFHPLTAHAVLRQHQQQLVVEPDGLLYLLMLLAPTWMSFDAR